MFLLLLICKATCNFLFFSALLCPCFSRALLDPPEVRILILLLNQSRHILGEDYFFQYYGSSLFQHPTRRPEMNIILRIYSPLLICRLCYYSMFSSQPSYFNILTQYTQHKTNPLNIKLVSWYLGTTHLTSLRQYLKLLHVRLCRATLRSKHFIGIYTSVRISTITD